MTTDVHGSFELGGSPLISLWTVVIVDFTAIIMCVLDKRKRASDAVSKVQLMPFRIRHPWSANSSHLRLKARVHKYTPVADPATRTDTIQSSSELTVFPGMGQRVQVKWRDSRGGHGRCDPVSYLIYNFSIHSICIMHQVSTNVLSYIYF